MLLQPAATAARAMVASACTNALDRSGADGLSAVDSFLETGVLTGGRHRLHACIHAVSPWCNTSAIP